MSWTLSAAGRVEAGMEHLEEELHEALHKVLLDPRFGLLFSHLQGRTVNRMHAVGRAPGKADPAETAAADVAPAAAAPESAAADDAATDKAAKASKAG